MTRRTCRMKRTIKASLVLFSIFICLQLYYLYRIAENAIDSDNDAAHSTSNFMQFEWNQLLTNSSRLLYKEWNISTACILDAEAQYALNRAITSYCKNGIVEVYCMYQQALLYPLKLPRYCPVSVDSSKQYLGCFQDDVNTRIFSNFVSEIMSERNGPSACINYCLRIGFSLAGLQYGNECWCGKSLVSSLRISELQCNMSCPSDEKRTMCGGHLAMSVYLTGLTTVASEAVYVPSQARDTDKPYTGVRIAFTLTVNGRALRQVTRLLRVIYRPHHYYYIHVDARRDYLYRELFKLIGHFRNVRMDTSRHSTIWGGASLLTMLLDAMDELLLMKDWHWDYFLNLSESDYPVKSVEELETFLTKYEGKNFVKSHGRDTVKFIRKQGLNMLFYECENRMWRLGPRQLQEGIRIDGGSDWICLNREFIQYVLSSDVLVAGLKSFWRYSLLPAESFFHTVLQNSVFCDTVINNNLHLTNWRRKQGCKCQYKHVVDWCGCSPNDILPRDFHRLLSLTGRPIYFARKFEAAVSLTSLNLVDELVYGISLQADMPSLTAFWLNEYHHEDSVPDISTAWINQYLAFVYMSLEHINTHALCQFSLSTLRESTVFTENDKFVGIVVTYQAATSDNSSQGLFESLMKPAFKYKQLDVRNKVARRLASIQVGTDFDAKEALFRNYAGLISSDSEIGIHLSWHQGPPASSVLVSMITPTDHTAHVANINVTTESATMSFYQPVLSQPLPAGVWTARASLWSNDNEIIIGEMPFIVVSSVMDRTENIVPLLAKAWTVAGNCAVSDFTHRQTLCQSQLSLCARMPWSTQYPDPKSWIDEHAMQSWSKIDGTK